jgi:hypothetical protein
MKAQKYMKSIIPVKLLICCAIFYGVHCTSPTKPIDVPDTTSHNFNWQKFILGDGAGSMLRDVAIINDTLVYAVGQINVKDSLGNWVNPPYNLARWNGQHWELLRLLWDCCLYYPDCGPSYFLYSPIRSIFAFGPNDIWVTAGTAQHFDGTQWTEHAGIEGVGGADKIWGTGSNDLYFVGHAGLIVYKSGDTWHRVNSGTELPIRDIWGARNEKTGEWEILAIASSSQTDENSLLKILPDNTVVSLNIDGLSPFSTGIWFVPGEQYYIVGSGIHRKSSLSDPVIYVRTITDLSEAAFHVHGVLLLTVSNHLVIVLCVFKVNRTSPASLLPTG